MAQKQEDSQMRPVMDPRLLQAMNEEDEIDLLAYFDLLWQKRVLIISVSLLAAVLAAVFSLMMPNIYRSEALLAPVVGDEDKGGISSMLGGLGGLASLTGVSLGGGGSTEESLAVLTSREFIWGFVKAEKLMPVLFKDAWDSEKKRWLTSDVAEQPSLWDAWRLLIDDRVLTVNLNDDSGLVSLAIDWQDPELAASWVTKLVERINNHLREKTILQSNLKLEYLEQELARTHIEENRLALFELIAVEQKQAMLANTQQDFAFRVIDPASVPDKKIRPKRSIIVIAVTFVVGFLCILFVFIQEVIRKRKEEAGGSAIYD